MEYVCLDLSVCVCDVLEQTKAGNWGRRIHSSADGWKEKHLITKVDAVEALD